MDVCFECLVLWGRGTCDKLITRPEESYRLWCVVVCDLETSRIRRPWPALGRSTTGKKKLQYCIIHCNMFQLSSSVIIRDLSACISVFCIRHLPDDGWSGQSKHVVYNKRLLCWIYKVVFGRKRIWASSCLSFCPYWTVRLPLDEFSWNFVWLLHDVLLRALKLYSDLTRMTGTLHADRCTLMIVSRGILLRMRNVSDKSHHHKHQGLDPMIRSV